MVRFLLITLRSSLTCKFEINTRDFRVWTDLRSGKIKFYTPRLGDLEWCVLC